MRKTSEKSQLKDTVKLLNHYYSKLSRLFKTEEELLEPKGNMTTKPYIVF